jgi:hypothetical protein
MRAIKLLTSIVTVLAVASFWHPSPDGGSSPGQSGPKTTFKQDAPNSGTGIVTCPCAPFCSRFA